MYDIQDIGSRSYTFISSLGLLMEAAAENNIPVVVLDRPNPLGGIRMEGALTRPGFFSFVSQFAIPYMHGLTVGELAMLLNGEGMLANGVKCDLQVVKMNGWSRKMYFEETRSPLGSLLTSCTARGFTTVLSCNRDRRRTLCRKHRRGLYHPVSDLCRRMDQRRYPDSKTEQPETSRE